MPESLNTRKKLLKTLQLTDYATLIEDLNFNFGVLLSSPLFIGLQGDPGTDGTQGPAGIRGSKWMFASLDAFREQWPEDNLLGEYQITLDYLNTKLLNDEDRNKLLLATGAGDMFVNGDTFVANSKIYSLDLSNNRFVDTGQTVNNSSETYQQNLQNYIIQVINETLKNNPVYMGLVQTIDFQYAQGKNYVDSSGNINNELNESSMLDVTSTSSKDGVSIDSHKMFLPSGNVFDDDDNLTLILGSAEAYHNIVQGTLSFNEKDPASSTVSKFGPTYGNPPSMVILQDCQTNGVMIGYKKASNFTQFGKFWVNAENGFVISSPNVSDHYLKFSDIQLYNDRIDFNADVFNFNGDVTFRKLSFNEISTKNLSIKDKEVKIGDTFTDTHILGNGVYFDGINECNFIRINKDHKFVASAYDIDTTTSLGDIQASKTKMPNMELIYNLYQALLVAQENLVSTQNALDEARKANVSTQTYLEKRIASKSVESALLKGQIIDLCIYNKDHDTYDIIRTRMFDSSGRGRSSVTYWINDTDKVTSDLSSYKLCDGKNSTPNMIVYDTDAKDTYFVLRLMFS